MTVHRYKAFFLLILSALGLVILAVGLPALQLQPGLPIPGAADSVNVKPGIAADLPAGNPAAAGWLLQGTLSLLFFLLLFLLFIGIVRYARVKRLLLLASGLAAILLLLLLLPPVVKPSSAPPPVGDFYRNPPAFQYSVAPIGNPPAEIYWLVTVLLSLSAVLLGVWILVQFRRKRGEENPLARAAGAALQSIEAGQNLQSVIVRCYLDMEKSFKDERGFERGGSVTPREFENWLASHGVPILPVRQLTRLFEMARYSSHLPDKQDEQAAVACLSAILENCQQVKK